MGIEQSTQQSIYTPSALPIVLLCVHAPRGLFRVPFLPHPPPLSDGNLYPAALLCMRGNCFRPYLSILACAIEVQHNNENPTTVCLWPVEILLKEHHVQFELLICFSCLLGPTSTCAISIAENKLIYLSSKILCL